MIRFVDFIKSSHGLSEARRHSFELNGVQLGRFTALFIHDNQVIFTREGQQSVIPYYVGAAGDLLSQTVNPRIFNICAV